MDLRIPPSLICPLTLKPNPVDVFVIVTILGAAVVPFDGGEGMRSSSLSAMLNHVISYFLCYGVEDLWKLGEKK